MLKISQLIISEMKLFSLNFDVSYLCFSIKLIVEVKFVYDERSAEKSNRHSFASAEISDPAVAARNVKIKTNKLKIHLS